MSSVDKLGRGTEGDLSDEHLISSLQADLHFLRARVQELESQNHSLSRHLANCRCNQIKVDHEGLAENTKRLQLANNKVNGQKLKETTRDSGATLNWKFPRRFVALKIMYFGKRFYGFASEAQMEPTVESEIFKALEKTRLINGDKKDCQYSRCGRTDKGVSSVGQVIGLYLRSNHKEGTGHNDAGNSFPEQLCVEMFCLPKQLSYRWDHLLNLIQQCISFLCYSSEAYASFSTGGEIDYVKLLNRVLPNDIRVMGWSPAPNDFSARFSCLSRVYKYFFWKQNLNTKAMETAGMKLIGEHDFRNFCKMDAANVHNYKRHIRQFEISCCDEGIECKELWTIKIKGTAFLWHQIRCIVAVLFLIGQDLETPNVIDHLLNIERTPRKPQYKMASEVPLVLQSCEFEDLKFICSSDASQALRAHLEEERRNYILQAAIFNEALISLSNFTNDFSILDQRSRKKESSHIPLMSRPTEPSYEERRAKLNSGLGR